MNPDRLREQLRRAPVAGEPEARRRSWAVVRAAFEEREPVSWPVRHARPLLAMAAVLAVLAAAFSPPGQALVGSLRDAIGRERVVGVKGSKPALFRLPTSGRLLVNSTGGPWIVQSDGSKRRLGPYEDASWSPRGLFVVATRRHELYALDPKGGVRWSLARPGTVSQARWSPGSGYRIAYLSDDDLRVVAGDGTGDRLLRPGTFTALAWRPRAAHVLAAAERGGRIGVYAVDGGRRLSRSGRGPAPIQLDWSADGRRLVALARRSLRVLDPGGKLIHRLRFASEATSVAFAPRGRRLALVRELPARRRSQVVVLDADRPSSRPRRLFTGAGRLSDVAWSPNGRWLVVGWTSADQLLFIDVRRPRRIVAVSDISRQFKARGGRARAFPRIGDWCCA